uniref:Uncharacterized protein n=1 Tax=Anopheles stephensi TaxID=30069 RepID=A0A182YJJ6_ANOST
MFNLTDPRNCCSIPYLLPSDVLEPCLEQTPLTPNALEGENCRAECIFNRTNILMDGHFQLETAGSQLTKAIGADSLLAAHIRYAINKCYLLYSKCPAQYWNKRDECVLLVRTLNECPYFLRKYRIPIHGIDNGRPSRAQACQRCTLRVRKRLYRATVRGGRHGGHVVRQRYLEMLNDRFTVGGRYLGRDGKYLLLGGCTVLMLWLLLVLLLVLLLLDELMDLLLDR